MESVKEKVSLITTLLDTNKTPGDVTVSTIHKLGNKNLKQGCRNLFDAGQALGAAKVAGAGITIYAVVKAGKWIAKKVKADKTGTTEADDPELQSAILCAQRIDREEMRREEAKQGIDASDCDDEIVP